MLKIFSILIIFLFNISPNIQKNTTFLEKDAFEVLEYDLVKDEGEISLAFGLNMSSDKWEIVDPKNSNGGWVFFKSNHSFRIKLPILGYANYQTGNWQKIDDRITIKTFTTRKNANEDYEIFEHSGLEIILKYENYKKGIVAFEVLKMDTWPK